MNSMMLKKSDLNAGMSEYLLKIGIGILTSGSVRYRWSQISPALPSFGRLDLMILMRANQLLGLLQGILSAYQNHYIPRHINNRYINSYNINFLYTGQCLYGKAFIGQSLYGYKVYMGTKFIGGQSLYETKFIRGQNLYKLFSCCP
jgi:hypothetical protein